MDNQNQTDKHLYQILIFPCQEQDSESTSSTTKVKLKKRMHRTYLLQLNSQSVISHHNRYNSASDQRRNLQFELSFKV